MERTPEIEATLRSPLVSVESALFLQQRIKGLAEQEGVDLSTVNIQQYELFSEPTENSKGEEKWRVNIDMIPQSVQDQLRQANIPVKKKSKIRIREQWDESRSMAEFTVKNEIKGETTEDGGKIVQEDNISLSNLDDFELKMGDRDVEGFLTEIGSQPVLSGMVKKTRIRIDGLSLFKDIMKGLECDHAVLDFIECEEGDMQKIMLSVDIEFENKDQLQGLLGKKRRIRKDLTKALGYKIQFKGEESFLKKAQRFLSQYVSYIPLVEEVKSPKARGREFVKNQGVTIIDAISSVRNTLGIQEKNVVRAAG